MLIEHILYSCDIVDEYYPPTNRMVGVGRSHERDRVPTGTYEDKDGDVP